MTDASVQDDARAAGALARDVAVREIEPFLRAWDTTSFPASARRPFADTGLLDPELPAVVQAEVAIALGAVGLGAALHILDVDPAAAVAPESATRLAGCLCGAAAALRDVGWAYAREREAFGRPLARFPVQRYLFAEVTARVEAATALVRRVAEAADRAAPDPVDLAACVPAASRAAWAAAEHALQIHGGYGYTDDYPVSRMWREVVAVRASLGV